MGLLEGLLGAATVVGGAFIVYMKWFRSLSNNEEIVYDRVLERIETNHIEHLRETLVQHCEQLSARIAVLEKRTTTLIDRVSRIEGMHSL